jgi:hypothetical protein
MGGCVKTISVIIPVYNGAGTLPSCLAALNGSDRAPDEVIVVDDSSSDGSADMALSCGARVIPMEGGPGGPAAARNRGATLASSEILFFIDADVVLHPESLGRLARYFADLPEVDAIFGSYDDAPADQGVVSRYKNLLHHHVHQSGRREATTFWAGCGAVRRHAFLAAGGFNERYRTASIEDVELGHRLIHAGFRVRLCPDVFCTHLKAWTLAGLIRCDLFQRAVPWSRLIGTSGSVPNDLNLGWTSRVGAAAAWSFTASLTLAAARPGALLLAAAAAATVFACNASLFRLFHRRCGLGFCCLAFGIHLLYLIYSSLTFAIIAGPSLLARAVSPPVWAKRKPSWPWQASTTSGQPCVSKQEVAGA